MRRCHRTHAHAARPVRFVRLMWATWLWDAGAAEAEEVFINNSSSSSSRIKIKVAAVIRKILMVNLLRLLHRRRLIDSTVGIVVAEF